MCPLIIEHIFTINVLFNYVNYALSNDIYHETVAAWSQAEVNQPLGLKLRSWLVVSGKMPEESHCPDFYSDKSISSPG